MREVVPRMEVQACNPIFVAITGHDEVTVWHRPHLPGAIVGGSGDDGLRGVGADGGDAGHVGGKRLLFPKLLCFCDGKLDTEVWVGTVVRRENGHLGLAGLGERFGGRRCFRFAAACAWRAGASGARQVAAGLLDLRFQRVDTRLQAIALQLRHGLLLHGELVPRLKTL